MSCNSNPSEPDATFKAEIEELKKEISGLKTENDRLLTENRRLTSLLLPTPSPHLPWEILHLIFLRATVPRTLVVPDFRPQSAWNLSTKTKLQLISVFNVSYSIPFAEVVNNMHLFSERLELLIIRSGSPTMDEPVKHSQHLQFPLLRVFQYHLNPLAIAFITQCWEFPALKTLACLRPSQFQDSTLLKAMLQASVAFIAAHGKALSTLLLYCWPRKDSAGVEYAAQEVIAKLSDLRHLIIPLFLDISAPQVHWLDCFLGVESGYVPLDRTSVLSSSEERKARFPKLQCYRLLDFDLLKLPLIYVLLPPTMDEGRFNFPGVDIRCDAFALSGSSSADRRALSDYDSEDELDFSSDGSSWNSDSKSERDEEDEEEEHDDEEDDDDDDEEEEEEEEEEEDDDDKEEEKDDDDDDEQCSSEPDASEEMTLIAWRARTDGF
ncbi:hypothetical protein BDP27DRAFT_1417073 [Rhodocollybia butyracea]|uniref:Uncharacterized protein n=1 Tax=Rhodocollybia butyracea TaxID=206335 RepID=A0A9P5Q2H9_9AGAR|nr:hypothetical protein BDP27DRAFT_1417073 [Rhodocollybia butyracea]